jgi:GxxExxY protein
MKVELEAGGLRAEIESEIRVFYKGTEIGLYRADVFVAERVIVEIRSRRTTVRRTNRNFSMNSRRRGSRSAC